MTLSKVLARAGIFTGIGCSFHCIFEYVCDFVVCSGRYFKLYSDCSDLILDSFLGDSMKPTLETHNILITNKIAQRFNSFRRNDVVIATHPHQPKNLICKRLIALPGDVVLMNSVETAEDIDGDTIPIYIKTGSCWLEGDNRVNSTDSRNYGQVPIGLIKSKVFARVWPPREFRIF